MDIHWHIMSLNVLNEDKDVPEAYREQIARAIEPVRVVAAARAKHGDQVVGALYTELGTRLHNERQIKRLGRLRETVEEALEAAGLERELADAMDSEEFDEAVRESHHEGIGLVGQEVGTPVIRIGDNAFFGPVITKIYRGEEAGRLWDGVVTVTSFEEFFELKRSRTKTPAFG